MHVMNKSILLKSRPRGLPTLNNFAIVEGVIAHASPNEILIELVYVSVDPYLRGRMNAAKSYIPPFEVGSPIVSGAIGRILESNIEGYQVGDFVVGNLPWILFQTVGAQQVRKIASDKASLSRHLGIMGLTGLTAYLGLTKIGKPRSGECLVVSGASGAVGMVVGQIGKIMGCRVVGITGSDKKVDLLKSKFGFDTAINYNAEGLRDSIRAACPQGVDLYFDNVGGEISDKVHLCLNDFSRIVVCGAISLYNESAVPQGPRIQPLLIQKRILMRGFIVSDFASDYKSALLEISEWLDSGALIDQETIMQGFENLPKAFLGLFEGINCGKLMVQTAALD
ncbi:UNVERIFIED_CONTAM: hypothetical protein GTU68_028316 [Idotea baltica]|nr:hypothetical protein [Idotea baltica]